MHLELVRAVLQRVLPANRPAGQLGSNLTALRLPWDDEAAERLAALAEPPDLYWRIRGSLEWN
ncbi:MAG: hypothetical protein H0W11_07180 [Gemmatimonadetes bacterium]|nr:hypothetical protein [Gemmatimonadota bacterium]